MAPRLVLLLVLVASAALRLVLVLNGGQYFWIDESHRLHPCLMIVDALRFPNHPWSEILDVLAVQHLHTGFILVGIPATFVALLLMKMATFPTVQTAVAVVLSPVSVIAIGLVYLVARRLRADRWEAVLAATLMACTNCLFYYARHVLSYDSALALALFALWWGLHPRPTFARMFVLGVLSGTAYMIYFGYLTSVLAILVICLVRHVPSPRVVVHAFAVGLGFLVLPLAMHAYTLVHSGGLPPFIDDLLKLMKLATQGGYEEGWRVPWAYLWHAEHGLLIAWLLGSAAVLVFAARGGEASRRRGLLWVAAAAMIYGLLAVNSTVLENSVVLGRFARQLVPFLCLATAAAVHDLAATGSVPRTVWATAAVVLAAQTTLNFAVPLRQWFIPEVEQAVAERFADGALAHDISIVGPEWDLPVDRPTRYVLLNTVTFLYPAKEVAPPTEGRIVFQKPHPLDFLPYQYEVFDEPGRRVLAEADISMRVVDTRPPD